MPLNLPDGADCFIDSNIFYYHFVDTPPLSDACSDFLTRLGAEAIAGHTSIHLLAEVVHKVMVAEAAAKFSLTRTSLVNWLQHHADRIAELTEFQVAANELAAMQVSVHATDIALLIEAAQASSRFGLLTNDATTIAMMQRLGLTNLVTNDEDFQRIPGLKIWMPR
jgi:predicted nucleic acid-binding protein